MSEAFGLVREILSLTSVNKKITFIWDVAVCILVEWYQRLKEYTAFHHHSS
jgi:hypothetical protein